MNPEPSRSAWSGDGEFTRALLEILAADRTIGHLSVADAPASRAEPAFSFISNEIHVGFADPRASGASLPGLAAALAQVASIGPPDYADENMLQYLRTERVVPAYQTRGFKMIEMVRIYEMPGRRRASLTRLPARPASA